MKTTNMNSMLSYGNKDLRESVYIYVHINAQPHTSKVNGHHEVEFIAKRQVIKECILYFLRIAFHEKLAL